MVSAAMLAHKAWEVSLSSYDYFIERARGGVGLIITQRKTVTLELLPPVARPLQQIGWGLRLLAPKVLLFGIAAVLCLARQFSEFGQILFILFHRERFPGIGFDRE